MSTEKTVVYITLCFHLHVGLIYFVRFQRKNFRVLRVELDLLFFHCWRANEIRPRTS